MKIKINGETREVEQGVDLAGLAAGLGLDVAKIVVELNGEIVPRDNLAQTAMGEGDAIEIVRFVGGG